MHVPDYHHHGFLRARMEGRGVADGPSGQGLSHPRVESQDDEVCFGTPGDRARGPIAPGGVDTNFDHVMGGAGPFHRYRRKGGDHTYL